MQELAADILVFPRLEDSEKEKEKALILDDFRLDSSNGTASTLVQFTADMKALPWIR